MSETVLNPNQVKVVHAVQRLMHASAAVWRRNDCRAAQLFRARVHVLRMCQQREEPLHLFVARSYFGLSFAVMGNRIAPRG